LIQNKKSTLNLRTLNIELKRMTRRQSTTSLAFMTSQHNPKKLSLANDRQAYQIYLESKKLRKVNNTPPKNETSSNVYANVTLKVTEDEKWAFKEWCVHNGVTQVDAYNETFALLKKMLRKSARGYPKLTRQAT
jgi:hypothetical protein